MLPITDLEQIYVFIPFPVVATVPSITLPHMLLYFFHGVFVFLLMVVRSRFSRFFRRSRNALGTEYIPKNIIMGSHVSTFFLYIFAVIPN